MIENKNKLYNNYSFAPMTSVEQINRLNNWNKDLDAIFFEPVNVNNKTMKKCRICTQLGRPKVLNGEN